MPRWLRLLRPAARAAAQPPAPAPRLGADELLRRVEWTVLRRLEGVLQGDYRTFFRGFGLDLADLREYQPGDDARYIDWNVTARLAQTHVRQFHEDREVAAWFVIDLSGSVQFGSRGVSKRELAAELVAVLGRLLMRHGNRVGAILKTHGAAEVIPARAGRMHVLHVLDRILSASVAPRSAGSETDLSAMMGEAWSLIKRRSVVLVMSDYIGAAGWGAAMSRLAQRHEVVAVRLKDPLESALPNLGMMVMQDAETGEQLFVDTGDRGFRERFAKAAAARETALRAAFGEAGVDCLELATDAPLAAALARFARMRKARSQLAAGAHPVTHANDPTRPEPPPAEAPPAPAATAKGAA